MFGRLKKSYSWPTATCRSQRSAAHTRDQRRRIGGVWPTLRSGSSWSAAKRPSCTGFGDLQKPKGDRLGPHSLQAYSALASCSLHSSSKDARNALLVHKIQTDTRPYLNDRDGHWRPHLMFFLPLTDPAVWGAGPPGSPVLGVKDTLDQLTLVLIPIGRWSDGTAAAVDEH